MYRPPAYFPAERLSESYYIDNGYDVIIEQRVLGFPFTPALVSRRGHETVIVEVVAAIDKKRVERWVRYGMSQTEDTRFTLVLRKPDAMDQDEIKLAHDLKFGLLVHNDVDLMEVREPSDLAVHAALPEPKDLPIKVRKLIAGPIKKFAADWRDGLRNAYDEVEQLSRDYLVTSITSGRVTIDKVKKGKIVGQVSAAEVEKMTLGQLKSTFQAIKNQNYSDSVVITTLSLIHSTRNGLTHEKKSIAVEAKLRTEAGKHLYVVISCLEELA